VNLYVLPYNFPELFHLLDELMNRAKGVPSPQWKVNFDCYMRNLPYYYVAPLRLALKHMNVHNAVPEQIDANPPFQLVQHMKKLQLSSKTEVERFEEAVTATATQELATQPLMGTPQGVPAAMGELFLVPRAR
jgi:integrator complex subunit 6